MKFAILRTKKLKTVQQITIAGMHNDRTLKVLNANHSIPNKLIGGSQYPADQYQKIINKLNIKERSNGVKAIEFVLTFSPEAKNNIDVDKWAEQNISWLSTEFGRAAILNAQLHLDESTPHIHALIIPLKRKNDVWRLCCRDFLGGASKLSALQDRYAKAMNEFGLIRGVKRSEATHQKIKEFYGNLNEPEALLPVYIPIKKGLWAFRQNLLSLEKLKLYTSDLIIKLSKISARQSVLKNAYLGERLNRVKLAEKLDKVQRERTEFKAQLDEARAWEQQLQRERSIYNEIPVTPAEARKILSKIEEPTEDTPKHWYNIKPTQPKLKL